MTNGLYLLFLAALACHGSTQSQGLLQPGVQDQTTLCQPSSDNVNLINKQTLFIRQRIDPGKLKRNTEILVVGIKAVENPDLEPLSFAVSIELPAETLTIGAFSLYPNNEPGIFRFRVSQQSKLLKATNACLIVKMVPQAGKIISDKVRVEFDDARWE